MAVRTGRPINTELDTRAKRTPPGALVVLDQNSLSNSSTYFEVIDVPVTIQIFGATGGQYATLMSVYSDTVQQPFLLDGTAVTVSEAKNAVELSVSGRYRMVLVGALGPTIVVTKQRVGLDANRDIAQPSGVQANRPNLFFNGVSVGTQSQVIEVQSDAWVFNAYGLGPSEFITVFAVFGTGPSQRQEPLFADGVALSLTATNNAIKLTATGRYRFVLTGDPTGTILVGNPTLVDDGAGVPGPPGPPTGVQAIIAGTNVTVDATNPAYPIVSATGGGGGGGTVTSVSMTVPTGFSVGGSPITVSGTLALAYAAGYQGYTTVEANKLAGIAPGATANVGTVTSVGAAVPTGFSVSGSPITSAGTLTITYTAGYQGYTTAESSKLAGIAPGATANVGTVTSIDLGVSTGLTPSGGPVTGSGTLTYTLSPSLLAWNALATSAKEDSFSKGDLVAGANVTLTGTLTGRLVGPGNITVAATGGGGGGGVTQVDTGTGLTGGPITTTGTVALDSASIASLALADSAVQPAALAAYAPLNSPVLTGDPTAPTPSTGDNDTSIATTAFVKAQGYTSNAGTVTSVAMTVPTGFSVGGSPITVSGTLALSYAGGYQGYTSAEASKLAGIAPGATANVGTVTSVSATVPTGLSISGSPITVSGTLAITYTAGYQGYTSTEATKLSGLTIGTTVQAYDADLTTIAGLTATSDNFMQAKAGAWASRTVAQVSADLQGTGLLTDAVGYRNIPQNSQSTAYTAVAADSGKHLLHPSADTTARVFTIPANGSVAYPIGTALTFINQNGAGVITISITTDTMRLAGAGTTGNRTLAANGVATAIKITSTEWIISGVGLT